MSWIFDEIASRGGEVPFDQYMELALYHPTHGYYSCERPRYGREGDYLTAPTASQWYARVVARLLSEVSADTGPVRLLDVASGDGSLIVGVLESIEGLASPTLSDIVSVERSPRMQSLQRDRCAGAQVPICWVDDLAGLIPTSTPAVLHASELFDALPVARVIARKGLLHEFWVAVSGGSIQLHERTARAEVTGYFEGHGVELEEGQIAEASLAAEGLHRQLLAATGVNGLVMVLDYGYESNRLYNPRGRRGGSLATFRRHRLGRDPLQLPGELDLTAHVNWDDLRRAAANDWREIGLWPLAEFMVRAGLERELDERGLGMDAELDAATVVARQEIKRLLDPDGMGSDLKVLVQAKGEMVEVVWKVLSLNE
jgi:SAM-dependent MidA family methyltransferase